MGFGMSFVFFRKVFKRLFKALAKDMSGYRTVVVSVPARPVQEVGSEGPNVGLGQPEVCLPHLWWKKGF
jgi:hypothetical protein